MRVVHLACGEFANQSERAAFRAIDIALRQSPGEDVAYVLTNLTHANPPRQADEIDMVIIGPSGAVVIEVKHWSAGALRQSQADDAAALLLDKVRRVAGRLRRADPNCQPASDVDP